MNASRAVAGMTRRGGTLLMIPRHPMGHVDIVIRLVIWLLLVAAMVFIVGSFVLVASGVGMSASPMTDAEARPFLSGITVAFVLSLPPLFWPRVPRGLVVLGVIWALLGGVLVTLMCFP